MKKYYYTAKLPNHKGPSIQGVAWGETIKRFYACVKLITGNSYIMFCITKVINVDESDVPKFLQETAKRPKFL